MTGKFNMNKRYPQFVRIQEKFNLSDADLSRMAEITLPTVKRIHKLERDSGLEKYENIAKNLDVKLYDLFSDDSVLTIESVAKVAEAAKTLIDAEQVDLEPKAFKILFTMICKQVFEEKVELKKATQIASNVIELYKKGA